MEPYLTYAIGKEGRLVHVDDVPNGDSCGCTCPNCGSRLIAKNAGKHNLHHFAHVGGSDCVGAVESALHLMAKDILHEHRKIKLPFLPFHIAGERHFESVDVECYSKELALRPDCIGYCEDSLLWVEFKRSHKVDTDKETKIKDAKIECIEIDINSCPLDPVKMKTFLEESSENRKWIYYKGEVLKDKHVGAGFSTNVNGAAKYLRLEYSFFRHILIDDNGIARNLETVSAKDLNLSNTYRCIACHQKVTILRDVNDRFYFIHKTEDEANCDYENYLKVAAKIIIMNRFRNNDAFFITPFQTPFELKSLGYTECLESDRKDNELFLTRNGRIGSDTIFIFLETNEIEEITDCEPFKKVIRIPIYREDVLLKNLLYNGHLSSVGIRYHNFRNKEERKSDSPLFVLYNDGHYKYYSNGSDYKRTKNDVYVIKYLSHFENKRDAIEFAVLKCLESNRKICLCPVCNHLTRHIWSKDECYIGKIDDVLCKHFVLYKFIKTRISNKYGNAKIEEISYNQCKEQSFWGDMNDN